MTTTHTPSLLTQPCPWWCTEPAGHGVTDPAIGEGRRHVAFRESVPTQEGGAPIVVVVVQSEVVAPDGERWIEPAMVDVTAEDGFLLHAGAVQLRDAMVEATRALDRITDGYPDTAAGS